MQETVFHDGEREMHRLLGVEDRLQKLGSRMVRDHMPDQHREFFEMLPMVHLCALDDSGHPFPLVRTGAPGFMKTPDPRTLVIHSSRLSGEVETLQLSKGAKISVVGIEFETRRRNRVNATIASVTCDAITLTVDQSYGNCPKYIQARNIAKNEDIPPGPVQHRVSLGARDKTMIAAADTFFIASRAKALSDDPRAGVDINHRGGAPGFVKVIDDRTIRFADLRGNNFYNTLGNLLTDPRVGVQFIDFETGTLLTLKGTATILEDDGFAELPFMGRSVEIEIQEVIQAEGALGISSEFIEFSPSNPAP